MEKFELYNQVTTELLKESISCTPESWTEGFLTIDCDGRAINYKLKNEKSSDNAIISDALRGLCEQLYVVMRQNGDTWVQAVIHFYQENESWSFTTNFNYESQVNTANIAQPESKPWWKFW
jgi:hypothetical protein